MCVVAASALSFTSEAVNVNIAMRTNMAMTKRIPRLFYQVNWNYGYILW